MYEYKEDLNLYIGGKVLDLVEIKNVSFAYHDEKKETHCLKNITFNVKEREFLSIVGPSGCGKSTLLSLIAKLLKPSGGDIFIKNRDIEKSDVTIGYMLQSDNLFNWRSIYKNVLLGLEIQNKLNDENIEYANYLLDKYGLAEFKNFKPNELSGGQRQRAALIRTLAIKPEILLLDEPFSALDYQTRLFVSDEIATIIRNEKKTAIMITHDISESIAVSDRVVVLSRRPASVVNIHEINLNTEKSPMKSREAPKFKDYFNLIWKELDYNEQ